MAAKNLPKDTLFGIALPEYPGEYKKRFLPILVSGVSLLAEITLDTHGIFSALSSLFLFRVVVSWHHRSNIILHSVVTEKSYLADLVKLSNGEIENFNPSKYLEKYEREQIFLDSVGENGKTPSLRGTNVHYLEAPEFLASFLLPVIMYSLTLLF